MATRLTPAQKLKLSRMIKRVRKDHPDYSDTRVLQEAWSMVKKRGVSNGR